MAERMRTSKLDAMISELEAWNASTESLKHLSGMQLHI